MDSGAYGIGEVWVPYTGPDHAAELFGSAYRGRYPPTLPIYRAMGRFPICTELQHRPLDGGKGDTRAGSDCSYCPLSHRPSGDKKGRVKSGWLESPFNAANPGHHPGVRMPLTKFGLPFKSPAE